MMDNNSIPIDLRIKRKYDDIDPSKLSAKRKSRSHHEYENPLDLSVKAPISHSSLNPISAGHPAPLPFYDPTNLLLNSSALLYDLFMANLNSYWQQRSPKIEQGHVAPMPAPPKAAKQTTAHLSRPVKEAASSKQELYACSCGEKFFNVAHLVSHLKITNHHAQLSSTHDEVAKLVRGQDIWLSRDTNPANQILKCLRCSLSFETLPDLTAHMMKTNHFTQLLPSTSSSTKPAPSTPTHTQQQSASSPTRFFHSSSSTRSTCLICSEQFAREVELVDHIQHVHQIRFNCTTCGMYFESESLYRDHVFKEMHYRNGKANRNRDYFLQQCKALQRSVKPSKAERTKTRPSIDKDVEQVLGDLLDRIVKHDEFNNGNALSLLENFVIEQTPSAEEQPSERNESPCETTEKDSSNLSDGNISSVLIDQDQPVVKSFNSKSNENPLLSLEKMLSYPTTAMESLSSTMISHGIRSTLSNHSMMSLKKKKFDKYRLLAEKMLRSTFT